ncbi:MAG: ShlB/FhaC/HecB family hemolysin secretion/activation protein [Leptolyngbya sp. SIOISBB]|nr:ShlB/FhaC/HecB family hemolysin secretion/activation protein [Leptolyngbya sp. SIOISBB]
MPSEDEEDFQRPDPEIQPQQPSDGQSFEITNLEIIGSTVFSEEELKKVAIPFLVSLPTDLPGEVDSDSEGTHNAEINARAAHIDVLEGGVEVTLGQLRQAANAITNVYLTSGYITSRATIPEQTIADGRVQIQVIEGTLEEIQVEGTDRLADYVRSRIALAGQSPLNAQALESQLRLLRTDPLFDDVKADLLRGTQPGSSIVAAQVDPANPLQGNIGFDTDSPLSVGRYRVGSTLQYFNLLGLGDRFSASANITTTGGSQSYEMAYQIPLNPMNGTISLRFAPSNFRITNTAVTGGSESNGTSDIYEVQVRQPLIRTFEEELAVSLGFRYRDGSSVLNGFVTPPIETSVFTLGQDYRRRDAQGTWVARSEFRIGTDLFGATERPDPQPDGQFFLWSGQVQRVQRLSSRHLLVMQLDTQLTPDNLVGSEQFFLGGPGSVRGYFKNQRFGDNGVQVSIADYITLLRDADNRSIIQLVPFVDAGYAWFNNADVQDAIGQENFLLSTGMGLITSPIEGLNASVELGVPLISVEGSPDVLVDFNLRYSF